MMLKRNNQWELINLDRHYENIFFNVKNHLSQEYERLFSATPELGREIDEQRSTKKITD